MTDYDRHIEAEKSQFQGRSFEERLRVVDVLEKAFPAVGRVKIVGDLTDREVTLDSPYMGEGG